MKNQLLYQLTIGLGFSFLLFYNGVFFKTGNKIGEAETAETIVMDCAIDDMASTNEDVDVSIDVLDNDPPPCTGDIELVILTQPTNGMVSLGANNELVYSSTNTHFSGCETFTYAVNENPNPTTANDDFAVTMIGVAVNIPVLNNDTDPQMDALTPSIISTVTGGTLVLNGDGQTYDYTPSAGFSGTDQFTYEISDGNGNTDQAMVTITVRIAAPNTLHYIPPKWNLSSHSSNPTRLWINTDDPAGASFTITNDNGTTVTGSVTATTTYEYPSSSGTLPNNVGQTTSVNSISKQGIKITSDNAINVQVVQDNSNGQSFLTSKSLTSLGTTFFAGQQSLLTGYESNGKSIVSVMATQDNTVVTITRPPGTSFNWDNTSSGTATVTLNENQTYVVGVSSSSNDITGAKITATKPIAAAVGSFGAGGAGGAVDNGWDQLVPIENVGSQYVVLSSNSNPDVTAFVATQDGTTISVDGASVGTYDEGEHYKLNLVSFGTGSARRNVTATAPVYAFQNSGRDSGRGENGLALIAPINVNGRGFFRFRTPDPGGNNVPIIITSTTSSFPTITMTDVTSGGSTNIGLGTPTAVPNDPTLSTLEVTLTRNREYQIQSNTFVQLQMFAATGAGGGISYLSAFTSSVTNASDDMITVIQDNALIFNPLSNDVDGDGDPLSISTIGAATNGTITDLGNGLLEYMPNPGYSGSDAFTYTITDGNSNFSTATVDVTVVPLGALPTATVSVGVNPVADDPGVSAADNSGSVGTNLAATITIGTSADTDGSETLASNVVISGVPAGLTFSAGTDQTGGVWHIPTGSLAGLTATSAAGQVANLNVCITNTDAAGCDTDGDTVNDVDTQQFCDAMVLTFICPVTINTVTPTGETCPGADDGSISVNASCTGCVGALEYSTDNISFDNNSNIDNLPDGTYTVYVRDSGNTGCLASQTGVTVAAGTDTTDPVITNCNAITQTADTGVCEAVITVTTPTVTDDCSSILLGNGLNFDGANDNALIAATSTVNLDHHDQRTVEVYFRVNNKNINSRKQVIWEEGGVANGINIYVYDGELYYGIYSEAQSWDGVWLTTNLIQSGQWHNAVLVYDGTISTGRLKGYLDGVLVTSANSSGDLGTLLNIHGDANSVGNLNNDAVFHDGDVESQTGNHGFSGDIDEIRIWTTARSAGDLTATNTTQLVGNETDLALYYPMDQGTACGNNTGINMLDDITVTNIDGDMGSAFALDGSLGCVSNWTMGSPALNSSLTFTNNYTNTSDASSTYPVGTTMVTWTATDAAGNMETCVQNITVTDNEDPDAQCMDITVNLGAGATYTLTAAEINDGSTDNCGTTNLSIPATVFNCGNVGNTVSVTLTVDDGNSNDDMCTAMVTVTDTNSTCCDINLATPGSTDEVCPSASDGTITASATCTSCASVEYSLSGTANVGPQSSGSFTGLAPGNYTVTAVDSGDGTCVDTEMVTIAAGTDTTNPTIACPAAPAAVNLDASCEATIPDLVATTTATDNCTAPGSITIVQSPTAGTTVTDAQAYTITITATDGQGLMDQCTRTFTVLDRAVVVNDDEVNLDEDDGATAIDVLDNDTEPCGDYSLIIVSSPASGTLVPNASNELVFTPPAHFSGCLTAEYAINVNPEPTTANNDFASTMVATLININVLANDTDPQNDPLTPTLISTGSNGMAVLNGTTVDYTPNAGFVGQDQFTYEISDGNGNTDQATVTVSVIQNQQGTVHYLPPALNAGGGSEPNFRLWINTEDPAGASGTITIGGSTTNFTVTSTNTYIYASTLTTGSGQVPTANRNQVRTDGIMVTSDNPVNVQIANENGVWQSFLNSKGSDALGTDFYAGQITRQNSSYHTTNGRNFITIMATEDNTSITAERPPSATWNWEGTASGTSTFMLDEGETYLLTAGASLNKITGSHITSDKPIAMSCGTFGFNINAGDHGWDMSVPVGKVGTEYVIESSISDPDETDFVATEDNTDVFVDGVLATNIDAGEFYNLNLTSVANGVLRYVTTSKPVYAYQFSGGTANKGENGMALVAPVDPNGRGYFRFRTPNPSAATVTVKFLTLTSALPSVQIDNLTTSTTVSNPTAGATAVPSAPQYSTFTVSLPDVNEFLVQSDAFIQIEMFAATSGGGAIAYISGFSSSVTTAADDNIQAAENTAVTFSPLNNDVDADGDPLTISNFSAPPPAEGVVTNNGNGTLTFTPAASFVGTSTFDYTITDGNFNFSTATITVTVSALQTANITITVNPIADDPGITAGDEMGNVGAAIPLSIAIAGSPDTDGSETLAANVVITGVPNTLAFSAGTNNNDGTWSIPQASLAGLIAISTSATTANLMACIDNTDAAGCNTDGIAGDDSDTQTFCDAFAISSSCTITINSITPTDEGCPGANDGMVTVDATCAGCTGSLQYSINGNPFQVGATFLGLSDGTYSVEVQDSGNTSCTATSTTVTVAAGTDTTPPTFTCPSNVTIDLDANCDLVIPDLLTGITDEVDNCLGTVIMTQSPTQSSTVALNDGQTTTVTITADDGNGNMNATPCVVTLTANNTGTLAIDDVTMNEGDAGTTDFDFTVTLTNPGCAVDVDYATADVSALAGDDYTATSGTLNFAAGESSKTITVSVSGDTDVELNDVFNVVLSSATNGVAITTGTGVGTITNDDSAEISINDVSQAETDVANNMTFAVTLSEMSTQTITVAYTTNTGTAGTADYTTTAGTLTFVPGDVSEDIVVPILGETMVESDETFTITLSSPTNATISDDTGAGTIENDDSANLTIDDVTMDEGTGGTTTSFTFTVSLDNAVQDGFDLAYVTNDGTATTADSDYTDNDASITFAGTASETQQITVLVTQDGTVESDETFSVILGALSGLGAGVDAADITVQSTGGDGVITNDDTAALSIADYSDNEANSPFSFVASLDNPLDVDITFMVSTTDGTATTGDSDYVGLSGVMFTILAGQTMVNVPVSIIDNAINEPNETFTVTISGEAGSPNLSIADAMGTGTIVNDDVVEINIADAVTVIEGDAGIVTLSYVVTLNATSSEIITVDYATADGTATVLDSDYTSTNGTLVFAPGETMQTIMVSVIGDERVELDQDVLVNLTNSNIATIGDGEGVGIIENDDTASIVIDVNGATDFEGDTGTTPFFLPINVVGGPIDVPTTINYVLIDGTATLADNDFMDAAAGSVIIPANATGVNIEILVVGDTNNEDDEAFAVMITTIDAGGRDVSLGDATAPATILDDDFVCPTMGALTGGQIVCMESPANLEITGLTTMSGIANNDQDFGIRYVYFNAATVDPYTGGTVLGDVAFASLAGGTATLTGATYPVQTGTIYVYGILLPAPAEPTCRPFLELSVELLGCGITNDDDNHPSIVDPCECKDNATTLEDGQFDELIEVIGAPSGETWEVVGVSGLYESTSPAPPAAPTPIGTGTALTEVPTATPGVSNYEIQGVHIDGIGYSIMVSNGTTTLMLTNRCWYPNPTIDNLNSVYCRSSPNVTLSGSAQLGDGSGEATPETETFEVYSLPDNQLLFSGTEGNVTLDIATLPAGSYRIVFTFDAADDDPDQAHPGCSQSIETQFMLQEVDCGTFPWGGN